MTIRTRMTLWYAGVLLVSILAITVSSLSEFHERHRTPRSVRGMEEILEIMLWIGIPAVLLSVGGGWWLMRKALAPLASLTRAAERVNERNLSDPLPRTGNGDELDRLTEALNRLTVRLHDSFTRIRDFTLHASHELKTPLTILCGETETALRDESLPPAQREHWSSQLEELRRLTRIVDGLTLLARADAGLIRLAVAPVRLDELVRDAFEDARILALSSGIQVELAGCEETTVGGDAHRLRQLFLNLVDNAVKYNKPRGSITMALCRADSAVSFSIANSGPGIAPQTLPRVFDRFFRGDSAHSSDVEGCGLGLSISQWIVSAHNGTIRVESEPGELTTVTVRLPPLEENRAS